MLFHAYLVRDNNRIEKRVDFEAADQTAALDQAYKLMDGCAVELWTDEGIVARFPKLDHLFARSDETRELDQPQEPGIPPVVSLPKSEASEGPALDPSDRR